MADYTEHSVIQRTLNWHAARLGRLGSTSAARALGGPGRQARLIGELRYERELRERMDRAIEEGDSDAQELVMNEFREWVGGELNVPALSWGRAHEDEAIGALELKYDFDLARPGMIERGLVDTGFVPAQLESGTMDYSVPLASSPDAMTDSGIPVEVKCPYNPDYHTTVFVEGPWNMYGPQLTHHALVAGTTTVLFASYDPREAGPRRLFECYVDIPDAKLKDLRARYFDIWHHVVNGTSPADGAGEVPRLF